MLRWVNREMKHLQGGLFTEHFDNFLVEEGIAHNKQGKLSALAPEFIPLKHNLKMQAYPHPNECIPVITQTNAPIELNALAEIFIPRVDLLSVCASNDTLLNTKSNSVKQGPTKAKQNPHLLKLRCFYFNARSLKSKLTDLHDILYNVTYDVIGVSETWFTNK